MYNANSILLSLLLNGNGYEILTADSFLTPGVNNHAIMCQMKEDVFQAQLILNYSFLSLSKPY